MHNLDIFLHLETYIHLQNFDPLPGLVVPILMIELFLFLNRLKFISVMNLISTHFQYISTFILAFVTFTIIVSSAGALSTLSHRAISPSTRTPFFKWPTFQFSQRLQS